ncbi:MAG: phosphoglucosamine mutase [Dehalococcoides mccartyi]
MGLFGTSGIRRLVDERLMEIALKVGFSVGKRYRRVVLAGDSRTSTPAIKRILSGALVSAGADVVDIGLVPTPTLAFMVRDFDAGLMVTASHNTAEYNGIKFLNPDGSAFSYLQQQEITKDVESSRAHSMRWDSFGQINAFPSTVEKHMEHILGYLPDKCRLKVVVDCGGGAASVITPWLLQRMGSRVISLNDTTHGFFPHPPEPLAENLSGLIQTVKESDADLGIAHDGDADRMVAVDKHGNFISGDKMLVLFARAARADKVVTTLDASMAVDEMGFKVIRTAVGDNYVSEELKRQGNFGGEPCGAWVFPESSLCPDGIYAAARLLNLVSHQPLSELISDIPEYSMKRGSVEGSGLNLALVEESLQCLNPLSSSLLDGIKLNLKDGWLLIRPSGTEPKIRLTAEAKTPEYCETIYQTGLKCLKSCLSREK